MMKQMMTAVISLDWSIVLLCLMPWVNRAAIQSIVVTAKLTMSQVTSEDKTMTWKPMLAMINAAPAANCYE